MKAFEIFRKDEKIGEGVVWFDGSVSTHCTAREGDAHDQQSFHTSFLQCEAHFERCQCRCVTTEPRVEARFSPFSPATIESAWQVRHSGGVHVVLFEDRGMYTTAVVEYMHGPSEETREDSTVDHGGNREAALARVRHLVAGAWREYCPP